MNAQFQGSLSNLEDKLNALITSLTTSPTAAGAPAAAMNLLDADDSLTSALATLRQHQENYAKVLRLREEAQLLEEKVKSIVREVVGYDKAIDAACGDDDSESDSDLEDDSSDDEDDKQRPTKQKKIKEVDYKLLLDFARRISKYNLQAAADVAAGAPPKPFPQLQQTQDHDTETKGTNGNTEVEGEEGTEPVATVTKDATSWLDESAKMTRQVFMLPYPMEDRIRRGLMAQIQLAGAEGRPDFDSDKEVERLIREAEGWGAADAVAPAEVGDATRHAEEAAKAAAQAAVTATSGTATAAGAGAGMAAAPAPRPKATLDLDLYDPDEDED